MENTNPAYLPANRLVGFLLLLNFQSLAHRGFRFSSFQAGSFMNGKPRRDTKYACLVFKRGFHRRVLW